MNTKTWLSATYGRFYENAASDNERSLLYFDPRCWSKKDIHTFFEDMRFGDTEVYEECLKRFASRRQRSFSGLTKAQARFHAWKANQNI
jgi:hypothetical protein